jgi:AraC-like DNA-binding protein
MDSISLYDPELLKNDYHPSIVYYYFKQWEVHKMLFHTHPAIEIMYVISGKCVIDFEMQSIGLKKGQFIIIDSYVKHKLVVGEGHPCRMLNVEFLFKKKGGVFPSIRTLAKESESLQMFLNMKKPFIVLDDPNEVYQTLKGLVFEMDEKSKDSSLMISLLSTQLLIRIADLVMSLEGTKMSRNNPYIKKTIDFIHHNYDRNIKVKDIANAVHLHSSYLHRLFKSYMGSSIMDYLSQHRMEKAKGLLIKTDIPVSEISDYVGMNSGQYFSTVFKKHTNMSPLEFRNVQQVINKEDTHV